MSYSKVTSTHLYAAGALGCFAALALGACSSEGDQTTSTGDHGDSSLWQETARRPVRHRGGTGGQAGSSGGVQSGGTTGGTATAGTGAVGGSQAQGGSVGAASATGCGTVSGTGTPASGDVVVSWDDVHQTMVGFGASDKYHPLLTDQQADLFFSPTAGIGLSMLRVAIDTNGNYIGTPANAKLAADRGAVVWAVPWSPPGAWKDNGSASNGGHLLPSHYTDWATRLAAFQDSLLQTTGVTLYGISPQNEANYTASWNSCVYTPDEMTAFIKVLGPMLAQKSPRPLLLMPEAASWGPLWDYTSSVLADRTAAQYVDVFSVHQYAGVTAPQTTARPIWETEYSTFEAATASIDNGISVAQQVHDAIIIGNASAWHYWWLLGLDTDNEGLTNQNGALTKRLFTVGNFSKFVRPGSVRIGTSADPAGVEMAAFKDPCTNTFAVVAINTNGSDTPVGLAFNGATVDSITPWVTSASVDLGAGAAVGASSGRFGVTLPARSVTTFVGSAH